MAFRKELNVSDFYLSTRRIWRNSFEQGIDLQADSQAYTRTQSLAKIEEILHGRACYFET